MLVLRRRVNESILIGDNVKVTVLDIVGNKRVGLGIEAPPDIPVHREEVAERIKNNRRQKDA